MAAPRDDRTPSPSLVRPPRRRIARLSGWVPLLHSPRRTRGARPEPITRKCDSCAALGKPCSEDAPGLDHFLSASQREVSPCPSGRGPRRFRIGPYSRPRPDAVPVVVAREESAGSTTSGPRSRPPTSIASALSPWRSPRTTPSRRNSVPSLPAAEHAVHSATAPGGRAGGTSAVVTTSVGRRPQPSVPRRISRRTRQR
jgi:hypothetical protein